ncbi:MAG: hypothetical protein H6625_02705 [Bdellovibrionaceae bacterium]|nr:hypothetical protein [Pseudobdellovibrionaceae bacterium]
MRAYDLSVKVSADEALTDKIIKMLGNFKVSGIINKSELFCSLSDVVEKIKNKIKSFED